MKKEVLVDHWTGHSYTKMGKRLPGIWQCSERKYAKHRCNGSVKEKIESATNQTVYEILNEKHECILIPRLLVNSKKCMALYKTELQ